MDQVRRLEPLLGAAALAPIVGVAGALVLGWRRMRTSGGRSSRSEFALETLLITNLVAVLIVTLGPTGMPAARRLDLVPFRELWEHGFSRRSALTEMVGNVLLFFPLGLLAAARSAASRSISRVAAMALGLSLLIEGIQLSMGAGREASVTDVVTNGVGAILGCAAYLAVSRLWFLGSSLSNARSPVRSSGDFPVPDPDVAAPIASASHPPNV